MLYLPEENLVSIGSIQRKYRFKKKLGKGGFCDVFLAENRKNGEKIAIKMMKMDPTGEKIDRRVARFRREMMLYSQLDHENIVKILDSGETETGLLFIVFEYIHGDTLAHLIKREGMLSLVRTTALMTQVLSALTEAHAKGIIHRDLKPENIMVITSDGTDRVKVLDFGISTFISGQFSELTRITLTKEFIGTPSFAAPEQLRGEPVSTKVDIYAWGLIFLECLTGKSPFTGRSVAAIVQQQLSASPVPLPNAIVNHRLGMLLQWTLEKEPDRRAGNAGMVVSHLAAVLPEGNAWKNGYLSGETPAERYASVPEGVAGEALVVQQERRQITVVCCTLNLQIRKNTEPPDVLDEIYQDLMTFTGCFLRKFGAFVIADTGDRILAFFGYPDASDTDARRAARSALELATSFARRNTVFSVQSGLQFSYRLGIHTGTVTVRKGSGNAPQLIGLTLNIASKVCNVADANSIFISNSSYLLLKDIVECREAAHTADVGTGEPIFKMIGERCIESCGGFDLGDGYPMVGRSHELDRIYNAWKGAGREGHGKVLLLQGEAGIGKSRLAGEFAKKIRSEHGGWMDCRCLPEGKNSTLHPILDCLRNRFGLSESIPSGDAVATLEKQLQSYGVDCTIGMPLFCSWLGLPTDGFVIPEISPQRQKDFILSTLSEILAKMAQASSSVIMIADLQWADPTTLELLPRLFEQIKKKGPLLLMCARPAFIPVWNYADVEVIVVDRLDDADIEVIIRNIFDQDKVNRNTILKIVARVDGVPLFAEEVTRLIREKGIVKDEIPLTLRDLLTGKIDLLGPAKETVQLASVIGRTFDYNLIEKVSLKDAASLLADLDQLISAGLLHAQLVVGNPRYIFHHALVRDAAYESLGKKAREEMHSRIAETLEREFGEIVASLPEVVARHWAGAGEFERAIPYKTCAAGSALSRALNEEAIRHSQDVLEWIKKIAENRRDISELKINGVYTQAMMFKFGWAYPQVKALAERSRSLLKKIGKSEFTFPTLWALATYHHVASNRREVRELADEMAVFASHEQEMGLQVAADTFLGVRFQADGNFNDAAKHFENAIMGYDPKKHADHGERFGLDTRVWAGSTQVLIELNRGHTAMAFEMMERASAWANECGHVPSIAINRMYKALAFQALGDKKNVIATVEELIGISEKWDLPAYRAYGVILLCWATGDIKQADAIIDTLVIMGCKLCLPLYQSLAADNEVENGDICAALARLDICLSICNEIDEWHYAPILHFRKGLILVACSDKKMGEAMQSFTIAAQLAHKNGMARIEWKALEAMQKITNSDERVQRLSEIEIEYPELTGAIAIV